MQVGDSDLYDVIIVGGGIVGATLACALAQTRLQVALLERRPPPPMPAGDYGLRVSALSLGARAILEAVGAWRHLDARRICPVERMHVWDAGGTAAIDFDAAEIGEPHLAYIAENDAIAAALWRCLDARAQVQIFCPAEIGALELRERTACVALAGGMRLQARLVVGADGAGSAVRAQAGIGARRWDYEQQAIVANVTTERAHRGVAWQRFLSTGPLAFLPLADGRCSIVWSVDAERARALLALEHAAFMAALAEALGGRLGRVLATTPRVAFPLQRLHAERYVAARVALIGDAAHSVHPLAGQGVNLGLLDAAALAEVLRAAAAVGRDVGALAVLRRYERWRKGDNLAMLFFTDAMQRLFASRRAPVQRLRNAGLALTDALGPVKEALMRRAAGIAGELPALARRGVADPS